MLQYDQSYSTMLRDNDNIIDRKTSSEKEKRTQSLICLTVTHYN